MNIDRSLPLAIALLASVAAVPAWSQQAPAPDDAADTGDIIVTAQKRQQSLSDVPLSINAASGDTLLDRGISDVADLAKIAPGFVFTKSINGTPLFSLRGVGFNDYALGASPAVSVYVDEVPLAFAAFTRGASIDLERVEVVKGPQGILYGQNSTGGAVNYIAKKPTQDFEAGMDVSFGRFNTLDSSAYLSGGLAPTLSARLSVGATESGGWQKSFTRDDKLGAQDLLRGRLQLLWEPSDTLTIALSANGWRDKSEPPAAQYIGLRPQRPVGSGATAVEVNRRNAVLRTMPFAPSRARAADWTASEPPRRSDWMYQFSARADADLSPDITLTSITAYTRYSEDYLVDRDGMTLIDIGVISNGEVESVSQELRLAGDMAGIRWVLGGNYAHDETDQTITALTTDSTNTIIIPGLPITRTPANLTQRVRTAAVFGNIEVDLTDQLTAIAGARYTDSRNRGHYCQGGDFNFRQTITLTSTALSGSPTPLIQEGECASLGTNGKPILDGIRRTLSEDNVSWRLGLNYKPDRDTLIYVSASRGYKSGSFPILSASSALQVVPVTQEKVDAYEGGFKVAVLDRALQINGAVFLYNYFDKQVRGQIIIPLFNRQETLLNVPKSRITGAELELVARPTDQLTLSVNGTYLKTKIREYTGVNLDGAVTDFSGSKIPYTPKWQVNANADYSAPISDALNVYLGAGLRHNSSADGIIAAPANLKLKAYTTVDAQVGIEAEDGRWRAGLFGRNIFNEYYWSNAFVSQDTIVRLAAMPATYGINLRFRY